MKKTTLFDAKNEPSTVLWRTCTLPPHRRAAAPPFRGSDYKGGHLVVNRNIQSLNPYTYNIKQYELLHSGKWPNRRFDY